MKTPIIFRKDPPSEGGECFALFPTLPGSPGFCTTYQHVGQHSSADYASCIRRSRPASRAERRELSKELRRIGYAFRVYQRAAPWMHKAREQFNRATRKNKCTT